MNAFQRGFVGEAARQRIIEFRPDLLFFSARAISLNDGITDVNEEDVYMKQQMLKSCRKNVFLSDSSKFDQVSYRVICGLENIDWIITNQQPSEKWLRHLKSSGVKILY
jgi:DeoR/GlpR family transcriptional regulator of sugar metabolism